MTDFGDLLGLEEWDVPTHSLLLVEPDRDADGFIPADSLPVAQAALERLARPIGSTHTLENLLQATVHRYPLARLAGDRVLVIETDGAHMERLLRDMESAVARFGLQMVAQPGAVPLAFGDETRDFRTRTLGSYVVSDMELDLGASDNTNEDVVVTPVEPTNPSTGAIA